jgi:hypothetical protein
MSKLGLGQSDHINQMITLTVMVLSGVHCTTFFTIIITITIFITITIAITIAITIKIKITITTTITITITITGSQNSLQDPGGCRDRDSPIRDPRQKLRRSF